MSKSCRIWLKINKKDFGKTLKCDITKLPINVVKGSYRCNNVAIPNIQFNDSLYLGIEVRDKGWYESGVGEIMKTKFNNYNSVLNLILLGHCESIDKNGITSSIKTINIEKEKGRYVYEGNVFVRILKNEYDYEYVFRNNEWEIFD